jgi:hypothetical protein
MAGVRNRSIFGNENLMRNDNSTKFQLAQNGGWLCVYSMFNFQLNSVFFVFEFE